jgi:purine-binding chemotaxis protein CheW
MSGSNGVARRLCVIRAGGLDVGIDVERMREVLRSTEVARIPGAPKGVAGLVNLRGEIVPAVDLRARLGRDRDAAALRSTANVHVVVATEEGPVSLLVDAVGDVVTAESSRFEPSPSTLDGPLRRLVRGTYKLEKTLLLALDVDAAAVLDPESTDGETTRSRNGSQGRRKECGE